MSFVRTLLSLLALGSPLLAQHIAVEIYNPQGINDPTDWALPSTFLGDLDQDGLDDIVIAHPTYSTTVQRVGRVQAYSSATGFLLWGLTGTLNNERLGDGLSNGGDIDLDGVPDFLLTSRVGPQYRIHSGVDGSLIFAGSGLGARPSLLRGLGDVTGDSRPDYIALTNNAAYVLSGSDHSVVRTHATPDLDVFNGGAASWGSAVGLGDVDGDGLGDYALSPACNNPYGLFFCRTGYQVFSGGTGTLLFERLAFPAGGGDAMATRLLPVGDFDGDDVEDFAWYQSGLDFLFGVQYVGFNDIVSGATGAITSMPSAVLSLETFLPLAGLSDLNGDGRDELLVDAVIQPVSDLDNPDRILAVLDAATLTELHRVQPPHPRALYSAASGSGGDADGDGFEDFFFVEETRPSLATGIVRRQALRVVSGSFATVSESLCFGEGGGSPGCTPCPCGNDAAQPPFTPTGWQAGCLNSLGRPARLEVQGSPSLAADRVRFLLLQGTASTFAILASSPSILPLNSACPAGSGISGTLLDGLRCIGGGTVRHGTRMTDSQGNIGVDTFGWGTAVGLAGGPLAQTGATAGQTQYFQALYRESTSAGCGTGQNTTNAVALTLAP